MRFNRLPLLACASLAFAGGTNTTSAADASRPSLCAKDEQIAFSCSVGTGAGAKLASLCASTDLSPDKGYVQYRFGKPGAVEMTYPVQKEHPAKYFRWGVNGYSGGGTDYFRFANGGYDYVVYSGFGKGWHKEGVVVERSGKRISSLVCRTEALDAEAWKVMYAAKLPEIAGGNEFDMP